MAEGITALAPSTVESRWWLHQRESFRWGLEVYGLFSVLANRCGHRGERTTNQAYREHMTQFMFETFTTFPPCTWRTRRFVSVCIETHNGHRDGFFGRNRVFILNSTSEMSQMECGRPGKFLSAWSHRFSAGDQVARQLEHTVQLVIGFAFLSSQCILSDFHNRDVGGRGWGDP